MIAKRLLLPLTAVILTTAACERAPLEPSSSLGPTVAAVSGQTAAKGGKPPADQPATATFRCPGPTCGGTDRILGDGVVAYAGKIFASSGEFQLLLSDVGRSLTIDYRDQLDATQGRRWFDTITVTGADGLLLQTNTVFPGTDTEAEDGLRSIPVGATWPARMKLGYRAVTPDGVAVEFGDRFTPTDFPGSTHVQVLRTSEVQWIVSATTSEIAYVRSTANRRGGGEVFEGLYHLPFQFTITVQ